MNNNPAATDTIQPPTSDRVLRIATRKSPLAMWQAEHVAALLAAKGVSTELVPLVSTGDVDMRPIDGTRQVGVFTKRIQQALLEDEADVAVHSLKDLPTEVDERLCLAAVPERETVSDCLVSPAKWTLDDLPAKAKIGTGSKRRGAQLLSYRDDLQIESIRGNVQTRLQKLADGEYDAIILADAGLTRLEMSDVARVILSLEEMLPAPGQGALAIEVRSNDQHAIDTLARINDPVTRAAVTAERTLLSNLNGGCLAPIAAYAQCGSESIELEAVVLSTDGKQELRDCSDCALDGDDPSSWTDSAAKLADRISKRLVKAGARDLIQSAR